MWGGQLMLREQGREMKKKNGIANDGGGGGGALGRCKFQTQLIMLR